MNLKDTMPSILNHTDLLNYLATTFNLQSYLEIGVRKPELNFDKIKCIEKYGIDPEIRIGPKQTGILIKSTSDTFFQIAKPGGGTGRTFDLIFIDGLHHADQVKRDFENSLKCLTDGGYIVIHDTLPTHEKYTHVPRDSRIWFGDVWKFAMTLHEYDGIGYWTLDIDCGCTVVNKLKSAKGYKARKENTWQFFQQHKKQFLNIAKFEEMTDLHQYYHDYITSKRQQQPYG